MAEVDDDVLGQERVRNGEKESVGGADLGDAEADLYHVAPATVAPAGTLGEEDAIALGERAVDHDGKPGDRVA